jgi:Domain of unknown function (DUF4412)
MPTSPECCFGWKDWQLPEIEVLMKLNQSLVKGLVTGLLSAVLAGVGMAASAFEGKVHMTMREGAKGKVMAMTYAMKQDKVRVEMPSAEGMGGMLMDLKRQELYILMEMDGRKVYMKQRLDAAAEAVTSAAEQGGEPVATGKTETIAGYSADEYTWTEKNGEVAEMWLAKDLGVFMSPPAGGMMGGEKASPGWEKLARERGFFPLRVVMRNKKKAEVSRMEVVKIERGELPATLFSLDGYTEFKMPGFGG